MGNAVAAAFSEHRFHNLCARIHDNSPRHTSVDSDDLPVHFTDSDAIQLAYALNENTYVRTVGLDLAYLTDRGGLALGKAISKLESIKDVSLRVLEGEDNHMMRVPGNPYAAFVAFLRALGPNTTIQQLYIHDARQLQRAGTPLTKFIHQTKSLRRLSFVSCKLLTAENEHTERTSWKSLSNAIANNKSIESLMTMRVSDALLDVLLDGVDRNTTMTCLHVDFRPDQPVTGLRSVVENNRTLTNLRLVSAAHSMEDLFVALRKSTSIRFLFLHDCHMTPNNASHLRDLLRQNETIECLIMIECGLQNETMRTIAEGLYRNQKVRMLDISNNEDLGGAEGDETIRNLLRRNRSLKHIDVGNTNLRCFVNEQGMGRVLDLDTLVLSGLQLRAPQISRLRQNLLRDLCHVKTLVLTNNGMPQSANNELRALVHECGIENLNLGGNPGLANRLAIDCANELVQEGCCLKSLLLDATGMDDLGLAELSSSLLTNQTLNFLSLDSNEYSEDSLRTLAGHLPQNRTLERFDIELSDELSEEVVALFVEACAQNKSITDYNITGLYDPELRRKIEFAEQRNKFAPLLNASDENVPAALWPDVLALVKSAKNDSARNFILRAKLPGLLAHQVPRPTRKREAIQVEASESRSIRQKTDGSTEDVASHEEEDEDMENDYVDMPPLVQRVVDSDDEDEDDEFAGMPGLVPREQA